MARRGAVLGLFGAFSGLLLAPEAHAVEPPDLTGTWRIELEVATHAVVPVLGTTTVLTRQTMVATVVRTPDGFEQTHDTCNLVARSTRALAEPTLPRNFIDAVPDKTYPLVLTEEGGRWRVQGDFQPLYIGFDPVLSNGRLPQGPAEPGVIDWDHDGKPGATILLQVPLFGRIEVYQAQRGRTKIDGHLDETGAIVGGVSLESFSQRTLSANNRLFVQNPVLRPGTVENWFRQERVEAGTTCASLGYPG